MYHGMGWDPKCPGWFDTAAFADTGSMPQLLFYLQYACRYPILRDTQWFRAVLKIFDTFQTAEGRYAFPAAWLREKQGYAVMGNHLAFGENRRKKNSREIASTFYMQLLKHHA